MLRQSMQIFQGVWGASLPLIVTLVLSQSSAMAVPRTNNYSSPPNSDADVETPGDIIIDTNPQSTPSSTTPVKTSSTNTRFTCESDRGQYTVMYHPISQSQQAYPWAIPSHLGGGWTAQNRCFEISRRLESYRPDGLLELRTGQENGYNTICVTTQKEPSCRIVLTVPPGKDPELTRNNVFQALITADSGQYTTGINTFTSTGSNNNILGRLGQLFNIGKPAPASGGINLRPFLDPADGGTGAKLDNPSSQPSNSNRLNPNLFR